MEMTGTACLIDLWEHFSEPDHVVQCISFDFLNLFKDLANRIVNSAFNCELIWSVWNQLCFETLIISMEKTNLKIMNVMPLRNVGPDWAAPLVGASAYMPKLWIRSLISIRANTQVVGSIHGGGVFRRRQTDVFLSYHCFSFSFSSLSLSLPSSISKINKDILGWGFTKNCIFGTVNYIRMNYAKTMPLLTWSVQNVLFLVFLHVPFKEQCSNIPLKFVNNKGCCKTCDKMPKLWSVRDIYLSHTLFMRI